MVPTPKSVLFSLLPLGGADDEHKYHCGPEIKFSLAPSGIFVKHQLVYSPARFCFYKNSSLPGYESLLLVFVFWSFAYLSFKTVYRPCLPPL